MALLDGKQIGNDSISLDKLAGTTGLVTFTSSATMSFEAGTSLQTADSNILVGTDVVNKNYVDAVASGLDPKESVRFASTADVGGTYADNGGVGDTITVGSFNITGLDDGGSFPIAANGDRILIKNQTDPKQNGIYTLSGQGVNPSVLTRAVDQDGSPASEVSGGNFTFVELGDSFAGTGWVVQGDGVLTLNTDDINWVQFSDATALNAGDGLTQTGNTLNVGAGTGLSASTTEIFLENTAVSIGSYGVTNSVSTFTVDQQGRLIAAGETSIQIDPSQVNNLTNEIEDVVFTDANFVDTDEINFNVTTGASVSATINDGSLGTSLLNSSGGATAGYTLQSNGTGFDWVLNTGDISAVLSATGITGGGTTGAIELQVEGTNGITSTDSGVKLGGTLTEDTTISGGVGQNGFLFGGSGGQSLSLFDVRGKDINLEALEFTGSGNNTINIESGSTFSLEFGSFGGGGGVVTDSSGNGYGLVYSADYVGTFVSYSLITKQYVDDAVAASTTGVSEVNAGDGLVQNGPTGSVTLDVVGGTGINANADDIEIDFTQVAAGLDGAGLIANGTVLDVNLGIDGGLTFSGDTLIVDTSAIAGDGLVDNAGVLDVNVNADSLEIIGDVVRLKDTVTGDRTFADSVIVNGNLTVNGTTSTINTENLYVEDNTITLNATYSGVPSAVPYSGIEVNLGDGTYSTFLHEESTGYWVGGLSGGSLSAFIQEAGTGLTKTGNTLSADLTEIAEATQGAGLTATAGVINVGEGTGITVNADDIEVNFTEVTDVLAGAGLTGSGILNVVGGDGITVNADDVVVDIADNAGITFSSGQLTALVDGTSIIINPTTGELEATTAGDISGVTAGAGLSGGGTSGFVTLDVNLGVDGGLTFSGDDIVADYTPLANNLQGNGLTANAGVLDVNTGNGLTINSDVVEADLLIDGGLTFSGGQIEVSVDNTTIQIVNGELVATTLGDIQGVTAGAGLSGGGDSGFLQMDVEITAQGGLTFSAAGDGGTLEVETDGTTIQVNASGQLEVLNTGGQPVYTQMAEQSVTTAPNTDNVSTTITIDSTPSDYSRIQIFVNGQLQNLGDGVTTTDCYFRDSGDTTTRGISDIVATDVLYWNGGIAGFRLTTSDTISISYEV